MYADLDTLRTLCGDQELVQLTDRADPPSGEIDEGVALAALKAASDVIDGFVAAQYTLPLAAVPGMLADVACDIARYRLYKTAATEQVRQRYLDAMSLLKDIARGTIRLPVSETGDGPVTGNEPAGRDDIMVIQSEARAFSRSSMRGM